MNVMAVHPATAKVYRCYHKWSGWDKARWLKQNNAVEFPHEESAEYTASCDESRCINAARVRNASSAKELENLAPEAVKLLKSEATKQINDILKLYEEKSATYISGCVSPYIV